MSGNKKGPASVQQSAYWEIRLYLPYGLVLNISLTTSMMKHQAILDPI